MERKRHREAGTPRRRSPVTHQTLAASVALLVTVAGCGRPHEQRGTDAARVLSWRTGAMDRNTSRAPSPCPPQPVGPQVGRSDARIEAARTKLSEWAGLWAPALPNFALDSIWRVSTRRFTPVHSAAYEPRPRTSDADVTFELLGVRSPDGRYTLDVDAYQVVTFAGDSLQIGGEPDSRCTLIDHRLQTEATLDVFGTTGSFDWGTWLSPTSFAVAGWRNADDVGDWKVGFLRLYSLADTTVTEYVTRIVPVDAWHRYRGAWNEWLLQRSRALRRR